MVKVLIDTKGGDQGAAVMVKGACEAIRRFEALGVVLVGDEAFIQCRNLTSVYCLPITIILPRHFFAKPILLC